MPEIWCYDDGEIIIYLLQAGKYQPSKQSLVFPNLPIQDLPGFIERYRSEGRRALRRAVRVWVREHQAGETQA